MADSDWKSRATPVSTNDWKSRATPVNDDDNPDSVDLPEAITRKLGQGLTANWMDKAAAATQAGVDVGLNYLPKDVVQSQAVSKLLGGTPQQSGKSISDLKDLYEQYKQLQQERETQASEKYPKTSMASEIAGGILSPASKLAGGLKGAVALGGLYGLGGSQADVLSGDPDQLAQAAKDTAVGAVSGGVSQQVVAPALSKVIGATGIPSIFQKAGQNLQTEAEDTAGNILLNKGLQKVERGGSAGADVGTRKGIGKEAYENMTFTGGPEGIRNAANTKIDQLEAVKKPLLDQANDKLQSMISDGNINDLLDTAGESTVSNQLKNLKDGIINKQIGPQGAAVDADKVKKLDDTLTDTINRFSQNDHDINALNDLKKNIGDTLGDKAFQKQAIELPEQAEFLKGAYSIVKGRIEQLADKVEPNLGQQIKDLNNQQSISMNLRDAAFDTELSKAATKPKLFGVGPGDFVAYGAGHLAAGPVGGLAAVAAKKGVEKATGWDIGQLSGIAGSKILGGAGSMTSGIGNAMTSPTTLQAPLRTLSSMTPTSSEMQKEPGTGNAVGMKPLEMSHLAYSSNPQQISQAAQKLQTNPSFKAYGDALQKAMTDKSEDSKNAVIFTILQNPNMRKFLGQGDQNNGQ